MNVNFFGVYPLIDSCTFDADCHIVAEQSYGGIFSAYNCIFDAAELNLDSQGGLIIHNSERIGKYVSFKDEVRLEDLAVGFEAALSKEVGSEIGKGRRFICITHSTGGPVVRLWWDRYHFRGGTQDCPMSHLIMLAPANFGSALAQLGKGRVSRLKSWFEGVEPGQGVLDWLELGSPESWDLNRRWIASEDVTSGDHPVFPFVLSGQTINRRLYDHVNSYTGEMGSDGVVRLASAQLNACYAQVTQESFAATAGRRRGIPRLKVEEREYSRLTAFAVLEGRSHAGEKMGIIASIENDVKSAIERLSRRSTKLVKLAWKCSRSL